MKPLNPTPSPELKPEAPQQSRPSFPRYSHLEITSSPVPVLLQVLADACRAVRVCVVVWLCALSPAPVQGAEPETHAIAVKFEFDPLLRDIKNHVHTELDSKILFLEVNDIPPEIELSPNTEAPCAAMAARVVSAAITHQDALDGARQVGEILLKVVKPMLDWLGLGGLGDALDLLKKALEANSLEQFIESMGEFFAGKLGDKFGEKLNLDGLEKVAASEGAELLYKRVVDLFRPPTLTLQDVSVNDTDCGAIRYVIRLESDEQGAYLLMDLWGNCDCHYVHKNGRRRLREFEIRAYARLAKEVIVDAPKKAVRVVYHLQRDQVRFRITALCCPPETTQTSRVMGGPAENLLASAFPKLSADASRVAFTTAGRLLNDDRNEQSDIYVWHRLWDQLVLVSTSAAGVTGNGPSSQPALSASGERVVFVSEANNLVPGDRNEVADIFVKDLDTGRVRRVSVGPDEQEADQRSSAPAISASGKIVAFTSRANYLLPGNQSGRSDVFIRDLETGTLSRISVAPNGLESDGDSSQPSVSADGRFVAFASHASNLVSGDVNGAPDIFLHDRAANLTTCITLGRDSWPGAGFITGDPVISGDGRFVAFVSDRSDLVPEVHPELPQVFLHDTISGETLLVSRSQLGEPATGDALTPSVSEDGRWVAFSSDSSGLVEGDDNWARDVFLFDRNSGVIRLLSRDEQGVAGDKDSGGYFHGISLSADGRTVAFQTQAENLRPGDRNATEDVLVMRVDVPGTELASAARIPRELEQAPRQAVTSADGEWVAFSSAEDYLVPEDNNGHSDIFLVHRVTGRITLVSRTAMGLPGNGDSSEPSLSADGLRVAFRTLADNLVPNDLNGTSDVVVHDLRSHQTLLASRSLEGHSGNEASFHPSLSPDGSAVAFVSLASDLVPNDGNRCQDVFTFRLASGTIHRVSVNDLGIEGNGPSGEARDAGDARWISRDGNTIVFTSLADNLVSNDRNEVADVFVHQWNTGITLRVGPSAPGSEATGPSYGPTLSADGRLIGFVSEAANLVDNDRNESSDVFLCDVESLHLWQISTRTSGGAASGASGRGGAVSISPDGNFVAFASEAADLTMHDENGASDIYRHNRLLGSNERVSLGVGGTEAAGVSDAPSLSLDARTLVFRSNAENLTEGDTNQLPDLFVHNQPTPVAPHAPGVSILRDGDWLVVSWNDGRLESSATVGGPFVDVGASTSPVRVKARELQRFYRARTLNR